MTTLSLSFGDPQAVTLTASPGLALSFGEPQAVVLQVQGIQGPPGSGGGGVTDGDKGDITVSGGGTVWTIDAGAVTLADLAPINQNRILGRNSAGTGDVEAMTLAQTRAILNVADGATAYTDEAAQDAVGAMVDASLTYVDATPLLQRAALTGAITAAAGSNATSLGSFTKAQLDTAVSDGNVQYVGDAPTAHTHLLAAVTDVTMTVANLNSLDDGVDSTLHFHATDRARANHTGTQAAGTITGLATVATSGSASDLGAGTLPNARMPALTGDVTSTAGTTATTLATVNANTGSWGLAASVAQFTVNAKGLITAAANVAISIASTAISDSTAAGRAMLTAATVAAQTALLNTFTTALKGLVPAPGTASGNFLRDDGTWAAAGGGSPVTVQDEGSNITTALGTLNFVGAGVTVTGGATAVVTIPGGSGGFDFGMDAAIAGMTLY